MSFKDVPPTGKQEVHISPCLLTPPSNKRFNHPFYSMAILLSVHQVCWRLLQIAWCILRTFQRCPVSTYALHTCSYKRRNWQPFYSLSHPRSNMYIFAKVIAQFSVKMSIFFILCLLCGHWGPPPRGKIFRRPPAMSSLRRALSGPSNRFFLKQE